MRIDRFNIRVYGLLVYRGRVLVSDEVIRGKRITKFPGGGLEFGEGTRDCLVREVREEMGVEATGLRHFYTTDFFQASAYREGDQLVSVYYSFRVEAPERLPVGDVPFGQGDADAEWFRWAGLATARPEDLSLPVDQVVMRMLLKECPPNLPT